MKASLIYKKELKPYTIKRLVGLIDNENGKQVKSYQDIDLELAIYDKGSKLVKKVGGEDSYPISTIHVYGNANILTHHDIIPFENKNYTILETKSTNDYSFSIGVSEDV
ncbi:MAG: hypothetical protein EOM50_14385 [Erysipelotrichia bacterium]|nr:hypothetical protein [Erysipelotrichia bacterium]